MIHRAYIKCDVCGSVILTRTQIGWLPEHPIRLYCMKCKILISGTFTQEPDVPQFNISFRNAAVVEMTDPDFYIEISGELLTSKIRPYVKEQDDFQFPPFFNSLNSMGSIDEKYWGESFSRFKRNYLDFLLFIENDWPFLRRLHEIWLSDNHEFLPAQMRNRLPVDIFPLNNDLEYLRGIHQLFLIGFGTVLPKNFYTYTTKAIWGNVTEVSTKNPEGFRSLTEYFQTKGLISEYESRSLKVLSGFVERYPFFITAIGLESYSKAPNLLMEGTTTVSFEDVKNFYLECFEAVGEIIPLVVAYNNLKYRDNFSSMPDSSHPTIKKLDDFIDMRNKGNKMTFCTSEETFSKIIDLDIDNGIRNAIGHDSYSYDGVNQVILYYPSGKTGKGDQCKIYLIEFIRKTLKQFYTMITLIELIYQTKKLYFVLHGITPISSSVVDRYRKSSISRNAPCPCGSRKKYKMCCGKDI